jgi:hypothetical protein
MKKLIIGACFAAFAASPALAQNQSQALPFASSNTASPALMFATPAQSQVVVADGRIIGQDPDANVRLEILRSSIASEGNSYPVR